ncbi:MAG: hypothetical protein K6T78_11535 [Alicyclobacillus sp.]|nr:hypothetical protein [Alicyclobacillus sp.]
MTRALACWMAVAAALWPESAHADTALSWPMAAQAGTWDTSPASGLWITFHPPKQLVVGDIRHARADVQLAAVTLQGAFNQQQRSTRIYLTQTAEDPFWLQHAVPPTVRVTPVSGAARDPDATLRALLTRYGPEISGAIVTDPANPDTVNLATTLAGIEGAMVISPRLVGLVSGSGMHILHDFRDDHLKGTVATYRWAVDHLLPKTTTKDLVLLDPAIAGCLRDYAMATKSFVCYLTSTRPDERRLLNEIFQHSAANTPVLGYIAHEDADVAELSRHGHFLNASDDLTNASVWASLPGPQRFHQSKPIPLRVDPDTVYVAFIASEGDNAQYVQHRMLQLWQDPKFGAVPTGWTIAPGMICFAPTLMAYFYDHLPKNSELLAGPSGVGYATAETGRDLAAFAQMSGAWMRRGDLYAVDYWGGVNQLDTFARFSHVPVISYYHPLPDRHLAGTVVSGQTSGYIGSADELLQTIERQVANAQGGGGQSQRPIFLEPLLDAWHITPTDEYRIAQQLTEFGQRVGRKFVFTTPSVLALTMRGYEDHRSGSLSAHSAQAVEGLGRVPRY